MKVLAPVLKNRIQILQGGYDAGPLSYDRKYSKLLRVWAGIREKNPRFLFGVSPVRQQNVRELKTHEFIVRQSAIYGSTYKEFACGYGDGYDNFNSNGMGRQFDTSFSVGFDTIQDFNPLKSEYFILVEGAYQWRGRLFKIMDVIRDDIYKEYFVIRCQEVEERGTGDTGCGFH